MTSAVADRMVEYGLVFVNHRLACDGKNVEGTRRFVAELRELAEQIEAKAKRSKPYRQRMLMGNVRTGRKEADRIEATIPR